MAWANASGQPVKTELAQLDLTIPAEPGGNKLTALVPVLQSGDAAAIQAALTNLTLEDIKAGAINFIAIVIALVQLFMAFTSGNAAAIQAAIQALIKAITGN